MSTSVPNKTNGLRFKDKVCIVTGGSQGIGEGCVRVFVHSGAKVVFCGLEAEKSKQLETEMAQSESGQAVYIPCDVTKEEEIKNLIAETIRQFHHIDCLINNAGVHPYPQTIDEVTAEMFTDLFKLNVMGYFLTSKYALPYLRKTGGCIINISSLVAQIGQSDAVPYVATKGAITAMTRAMAIDEAVHNVRVNSVSPGSIWTPMWDDYASHTDNKEETIKQGKEAQLLGRMGTIQEAGELCLYLAAEASFLTGVDIPLSGGAELGYGKKRRQQPT